MNKSLTGLEKKIGGEISISVMKLYMAQAYRFLMQSANNDIL